MFSEATALLSANVDAVNALNVFPVPDGDTGTNMHLTMEAVVEEAASVTSTSAADVATAMAKGALMGARGNSGVILSQFFKGLASGLEDAAVLDGDRLAAALEVGRDQAYKAVGEPVEGTMLTVIRTAAQAARNTAGSGGSLIEVLESVSAASRESVALTPTMLPVLRQAGVVDAGGHGLAIILEGLRRSAAGDDSSPSEVPPPDPVGVDEHEGIVSTDFLQAAEEDIYGYCTQIVVEGTGLDVDDIRERVTAMGRSVVVVGDDSIANVHVHAEDPGPVVSLGVSLGVLGRVKIENMDAQQAEYSAARRSEIAAEPAAGSIGVLAVASGDGLKSVFESLGAASVLEGGDTMNPSVRELVDAVEQLPAESVVVLPNNKNIVPAASQAAELASKDVGVVPTRSIPHGIAAMLAFDPQSASSLNVERMTEATESVRYGEVTTAVRTASIDGISVEQGDTIGLLDSKLVATGDSPGDVLVAVVSKAEPPKGGIVTLYAGDPVSEASAQAAADALAEALSGVDVELVMGGQPHYHYLFSVE